MKPRKITMSNRLSRKNLFNILVSKFLNEYGYEKGKVIVESICSDILQTIKSCYCHKDYIEVGQMIWVVTAKDAKPSLGKQLQSLPKKVVTLTMSNNDDLSILDKPQPYPQLMKSRMLRWIQEAADQGGILTLEDITFLTGINAAKLSKWCKEHQQETGKLLPTRGNYHDIGPGITHKKQITSLYAKGHLVPEIARITNHTQGAVERYIGDYDRVKMLSGEYTSQEISQIINRGETVVNQYLEIINEHKTVSNS